MVTLSNRIRIFFGRVRNFVLNKRKTIAIFISLLFWSLVALINPRFTSDLEGNRYGDHIRHALSSWLFLFAGFGVFYEPLGGLMTRYPFPQDYAMWAGWKELPYGYPLGSLLFHVPYGILAYYVGGFVANKCMILTYVLFAHVAFWVFLEESRSHFLPVRAVLLYYAYLLPVFWALNGFYDPLPYLFALLSIRNWRRRRYEQCFLYGSLAAFLHYRIIPVIGPFLAYSFLKGKRTEQKATGLFLLGLTVLTAYLSFITFPYFDVAGRSPEAKNPFYVMRGDPVRLCLLLGLTGATVSCAYRERELLPALGWILGVAGFMVYAVFQAWYPIFLLPLLLAHSKEKTGKTVPLGLLLVGYLTCFLLHEVITTVRELCVIFSGAR